MPRVYDSSGAVLSLGPELGRGGEGAVWNTPDPAVVAKVYHEPVEQEKVDKLSAMALAGTPDLLRIAAWPTGTLHERPGGRLVGILLPKVAGHREIHQLYSPAQRRQHFPDRDWSFLLHAAMNCAAAVETVHRVGHVIGDLNQGGVLVSAQGMVRLIDCDSFQFRRNGRLFRCVVGVPQFTPPELQGVNFRTVDRHENHDAFGLALLIFHLLFMGRHPFVGRLAGGADASIEENISAGRFAFSSHAAVYQIKPPPHSLPFDALPAKLRTLFDRAFLRSNGSGSRPTATDWRAALLDAKSALTQCRVDSSHLYPSSAATCPWCTIEQGGGPAFFTSVAVAFDFDGRFDLKTAWAEIKAVRHPPGPMALTVPKPPRNVIGRPLPPGCDWRRFSEPKAIPPEPRLALETVPELPLFQPEVVPDDPPLRLLTLPRPPEWKDDDLVVRAKAAYRRTLQFADYRTAKWGTLFFVAVAAACFWYVPVVLGALGIALPFGLTWLIYFIPRHKAYRNERKRAERLTSARRAAWRTEVARVEELRRETEARNVEIRAEWEDNLRQLAVRREQAPERGRLRRIEWERQVLRVTQEQEQAKQRNLKRYEAHTAAMVQYRRIRNEAEQHNGRISDARGAAALEHTHRSNSAWRLRRDLEQIQHSWASEARGFQAEYDRLFQRLEEAKTEYERLRTSFEQERHLLTSNQRDIQLRDHLRNTLIEDASIPGIGRARKATLEVYGIETALDLDEDALSRISGFGPARIADLMAWKQSVIQTFRFDSKKGVSPTELRALHMRFHNRRVALQRELHGGDELLQEIAGRAERQLRASDDAVARLVPVLAQAEADAAAAL